MGLNNIIKSNIIPELQRHWDPEIVLLLLHVKQLLLVPPLQVRHVRSHIEQYVLVPLS
jgi:hypothetical protein